MSARGLAAAVRSGERSARSVVAEHLEPIRSGAPELHAFPRVLADAALAAAAAVARQRTQELIKALTASHGQVQLVDVEGARAVGGHRAEHAHERGLVDRLQRVAHQFRRGKFARAQDQARGKFLSGNGQQRGWHGPNLRPARRSVEYDFKFPRAHARFGASCAP